MLFGAATSVQIKDENGQNIIKTSIILYPYDLHTNIHTHTTDTNEHNILL